MCNSVSHEAMWERDRKCKEFYLTSLFATPSCINFIIHWSLHRRSILQEIETTLHFVCGAVATETKHLIYHIRLTLFASTINVCERIWDYNYFLFFFSLTSSSTYKYIISSDREWKNLFWIFPCAYIANI